MAYFELETWLAYIHVEAILCILSTPSPCRSNKGKCTFSVPPIVIGALSHFGDFGGSRLRRFAELTGRRARHYSGDGCCTLIYRTGEGVRPPMMSKTFGRCVTILGWPCATSSRVSFLCFRRPAATCFFFVDQPTAWAGSDSVHPFVLTLSIPWFQPNLE